jgi:hypothetical protein
MREIGVPLLSSPAYPPLSSRGLGRRILSPETRVRIPVAVLRRLQGLSSDPVAAKEPTAAILQPWATPLLSTCSYRLISKPTSRSMARGFSMRRGTTIWRILEDGIRPGSELGRWNTARTFHRTRPGHVYLATLEHCRRLQASLDLGAGTVRVDLRRLDPSRIDPDEDLVQHAWHRGERWVDSDPPLLGPDWKQGPHGERTLAHWAETTPGFDTRTVTAGSLAGGRISYRGTVPPNALEVAA